MDLLPRLVKIASKISTGNWDDRKLPKYESIFPQDSKMLCLEHREHSGSMVVLNQVLCLVASVETHRTVQINGDENTRCAEYSKYVNIQM